MCSSDLSAALVLAGRRWPDPLEVIPWLVWLLLVLPPLAMALWLLANWSIPANGHEGESVHSPQNEQR